MKKKHNIEKIKSLKSTVEILSIEYKNAKETVYKNKRLFKRNDYFTHLQEISTADTLKSLIAGNAKQDISNSLAGISAFTKPYTKWEKFMQSRGQKTRYIEDAVGGIIDYIPRAEYKINIDPYTAYLRGVIKNIIEISDGNNISNTKMINYLSNMANELAGKTDPITRIVKDFSGDRAFIRVLDKLSSRVKANAVLGNMNSSLAQFFNLPNGLAILKQMGGKQFVKDVSKGTKLYQADMLSGSKLINQSGFITERYLDKHVNQFDDGILNKPKEFANFMLTIGDEVVAKHIWYSAYQQAQRLKVNPITYADEVARRAVAGRGIGEVPIMQKNIITKLMAPFQVEVNNAWQLQKQLLGGKDKDPSALMIMFITTWLMNEVKEYLTGSRIGMDLIDTTINIAKGEQPIGAIFGEVLSNIPYGAQMAMLAITDNTDREKLFGDSDPSRFGVGNIGLNSFLDPFVDFANDKDVDLIKLGTQFGTPYGGKQLERMYKFGVDTGVLPSLTINKGKLFENPIKPLRQGAYTQNDKLKFVIDTDNPFNVVRGVTFGSYATNEGKEYSKKFNPLSPTKTSMVELLDENGIDKKQAYKIVKQMVDDNIVTGTDKYGNKLTVKNSKAVLNRELFEQSGIYDDIEKIINSRENLKKDKEDPSKLKPSDFGLNQKVFEMNTSEYKKELKIIK